MQHSNIATNITLTLVPPSLCQQPDGSEALAILWERDGEGDQWPAGVVLVDGDRVFIESKGHRRQIARCDYQIPGLPRPSAN